MPSFDLVCEPDIHEVENAINQAAKEVLSRWDLKSGKNKIEWDKTTITLTAEMEEKMEALKEILHSKLIKRGVASTALDYQKLDHGSMGSVRLKATIKKGIDKDTARKINGIIKDSKIKVQSQVMDEKIRVTGKSIDDLQETIALVKQAGLGLPLAFINMKRD